MPHLDSAYTLARGLTRQAQDAEDIVQEALVRAFKYFPGYRGGSARAWFLAIVRNTGYSWLQRRRPLESSADAEDLEERPEQRSNPETSALEKVSRQAVRRAVQDLPLEFREVIILRELEDLDYKEIAAVTGVPIGTVMSRLARGRARLKDALGELRTTL